MFERKSLTWPITLGVVMIVLIGGLTVGWVLLNITGALESQKSATFYWALLSIGSVMFAFVLTGTILYLVYSIKQHNLNSRQSNFIDAVTHELKSPIASLKLYLQTLNRHSIAAEQRAQFYHSMLMEVDRLDQLITQLLDVARMSHQERSDATELLPQRVDKLIQQCVSDIAQRHEITVDVFKCNLQPIEVTCRVVELDMAFRNLVDNAVKYAGSPPVISINLQMDEVTHNMVASIENNGFAIPRNLRRVIFQRFYRMGNELERTKSGTGLGLFLVKQVVQRMKGKVSVVDTAESNTTRIELLLPNATLCTKTEIQNTAASLPATVRHRY